MGKNNMFELFIGAVLGISIAIMTISTLYDLSQPNPDKSKQNKENTSDNAEASSSVLTSGTGTGEASSSGSEEACGEASTSAITSGTGTGEACGEASSSGVTELSQELSQELSHELSQEISQEVSQGVSQQLAHPTSQGVEKINRLSSTTSNLEIDTLLQQSSTYYDLCMGYEDVVLRVGCLFFLFVYLYVKNYAWFTTLRDSSKKFLYDLFLYRIIKSIKDGVTGDAMPAVKNADANAVVQTDTAKSILPKGSSEERYFDLLNPKDRLDLLDRLGEGGEKPKIFLGAWDRVK